MNGVGLAADDEAVGGAFVDAADAALGARADQRPLPSSSAVREHGSRRVERRVAVAEEGGGALGRQLDGVAPLEIAAGGPGRRCVGVVVDVAADGVGA